MFDMLPMPLTILLTMCFGVYPCNIPVKFLNSSDRTSQLGCCCALDTLSHHLELEINFREVTHAKGQKESYFSLSHWGTIFAIFFSTLPSETFAYSFWLLEASATDTMRS